ncbi:hypothetical protein [Sorangium sp. So ce887]|uniref:hypothetical protein n=1 Tax=Sorangium sp. So ce887 TaxID=3133324 RepID=UPI003F6392DF
MTLPYEETLRWFEGEIRGQTGGAVGGAVGGYPGSIQGREIAMGLNVDPWMPKWEPPKTVSVKGEVVGLIGLSAEDGTLLDPVTGEPMDQARAEQAVRLLLGHTMDHLRGAGTVALDRALGELSGAGAALLGGAPDERLADATRPGTSDDPSWSMRFEFDAGTSRTDGSPARSAPAPQPSLLEVLGSMYGGHVVSEPAEPPSIFDASVYDTGAPAAPAVTAPVSPAGAAGALAGSPFVAAPPPGGPSAPSGGVVTAPRAPGASGSGALYKSPAALPLDPLRELWPPTPAGSLAELFDAVTPGRPQLPRGSAGAPRGVGDDPNDQGDLDRWAFDLALLGAVEAIPELLLATAKQMAKNALYLTPVGIPLAIDDINDLIDELGDAVDRNGGGVPGMFNALNERFNPLAGLVRNTVDAVEAYEDRDARKLGNRMFKLGIEVLGMAAVLRGGGKGGKGSAAGGGRLGPGDNFAAYVSGSDGVLAELGKDGFLDLYIKAGPGTPRGSQMFKEALDAFGSNVKGIRGTWLGGGDLASNFDSFGAALKSGLTPEQAAFKTFTGKMAYRAGFTRVKIVTNNARKVVVEFY